MLCLRRPAATPAGAVTLAGGGVALATRRGGGAAGTCRTVKTLSASGAAGLGGGAAAAVRRGWRGGGAGAGPASAMGPVSREALSSGIAPEVGGRRRGHRRRRGLAAGGGVCLATRLGGVGARTGAGAVPFMSGALANWSGEVGIPASLVPVLATLSAARPAWRGARRADASPACADGPAPTARRLEEVSDLPAVFAARIEQIAVTERGGVHSHFLAGYAWLAACAVQKRKIVAPSAKPRFIRRFSPSFACGP